MIDQNQFASNERFKKIVEMIGDNGKLLDIGGGIGLLSDFLPEGIDYYLVDSSKDSIKKSKCKNKFVGDIEKIPFASNTFDYAVLGEVVEHLPNPVSSLKEVKRVLKKNGCLVITVPNAGFERRLFSLIGDLPNIIINKKQVYKKLDGLGGHLYMFDTPHMDLLVRTAGFKVEQIISGAKEKNIVVKARK